MKEKWNEFYRENKYVMWFPGEAAIKFFGRVSKEMDIVGKKGLDFGCGVGRHTKFMKDLGIEAYGVDISDEAIILGRERFKDVKIFAYTGDIIPFRDNYFDFVISHGVLDHVLFKEAKTLMKEIYRVLKPNGWVELEIHSIHDSRYNKGKEIDRNTFMMVSECEKGLLQHFFSREELYELMGDLDFELKKLILNEEIIIEDNEKTSFWVVYLQK